jgi:hypothetical protein
MLLSGLCADECGVVWPYVLVGGDLGVITAPGNIEAARAEFAAVVEERRRREMCRPVRVAELRALQHQIVEQSNQITEQLNQIVVLNDTVSGLASQNAEQNIQNTEQSNQIASLQRSTDTIVEQNELMQEQMRQMHALLMSRVQEPSADVDDRDKRAVKRRRTGR